ncbi:hypothetical protein OFN60_34855, partial [Escherichia coli]|nr:hypothetical protein [Escherichia coli]
IKHHPNHLPKASFSNEQYCVIAIACTSMRYGKTWIFTITSHYTQLNIAFPSTLAATIAAALETTTAQQIPA